MALTPKLNQTPEVKRAAQEDVLLREVDDAVRQDQYSDFARKYGKAVIGGLVLALVAFGGWLFWENRQESALEAQSETLVGALDQLQSGNLAGASSQLDDLAAGEGGAAAQAALLKAGIEMEQGRIDEAAELYAALAGNGDAPQLLRDLATVREVAAKFDTMPPADVVARLQPLAVPGKPYFGSAGELLAMAYLEQGKNREAGALFASIAKDETQPEGLRSRTRQMAGVLGVDAIVDVDEVLDEMRSPEGAPAQPQ